MIKWDDYLLFFSQEAVSQLDAILDATYTDAKDICEHQASGWHQKYYITLGLHIDALFSPLTTQIMRAPNLTVTISHTKCSKK